MFGSVPVISTAGACRPAAPPPAGSYTSPVTGGGVARPGPGAGRLGDMSHLSHALSAMGTPGQVMATPGQVLTTPAPAPLGSTSKQLFSSPGYNQTVASVARSHNSSHGQHQDGIGGSTGGSRAH